MPGIKLSSQQMNTGGSSGGISPTLINSSIGSQTRGPKINVNAGNVRYHDMDPGRIVTDKTISNAAKAGMEMTQAAFARSERVAQADADEALLKYTTATTNMFYGSVDEKGARVAGYGDSQGKEALDTAGGYAQQVNGVFEDTLAGLSPSARAKATLRLAGRRNIALGRSAEHQAKQLKVHEDDIRTEENMGIREQIAIKPTEPWLNGAIDEHLKKYQTKAERENARGTLATYTLQDVYNRKFEDTGDPKASYEATEAVMSQLTGTLDATSQGVVRAKMNGLKATAARQSASEAKADLQQQQQLAGMIMPQKLTESLEVGNVGVFNEQLRGLRSLYPDDIAGQHKQVVEALKGSLMKIANNPSNINVGAKFRAASDRYGEMMASGGITQQEAVALEAYVVEGGLEKELNDVQNKKDTQSNAAFAGELRQNIMEGKAIPFTIPSNEMNTQGKDIRNALYKDAIRLQTETLAVEEVVARQDFKTVMLSKFEDGTISDNPNSEDMVWLNKLAKDEVIGHDEFNYAVSLMDKKRKAAGKKEVYQTSANAPFKRGQEAIKTVIQTGAIKHYMQTYEDFAMQPKDPRGRVGLSEGNADKLMKFKERERVITAEMNNAYNAAAKAAFDSGDLNWDSDKWVQEYALKTFYNSDKTAASWSLMGFLKGQSPGYQGAKLIGEGLDYIKKERYTQE